ncbi:MAG: multidrug effflux MFS transporter [Rhabdochlamydiaceae bacterium]|nr:multidrug effflux MFS transporter [Rhabdochlamydiaceae bacterium]
MNRRKELKYLFLIVIVFVAACIETDIYLPAFPDMMKWFSTTESQIQGLLTWNFVGICVSGPFYGPISDSYGRKKPILIALGMFLAGSIITLFAQTMDQMLWGRILQGLGSGGCFTLGTAIIFDAFQKEKAIAALNKLNTAIPLIMAAAPMLGGYLNYSFGFRSNFLAIAIFVVVSFAVCLFLFEETLPADKRKPLKAAKVFQDFKQAFTCLPFWQITLVTSVIFGGYIAFLSGSSVLFVVEFGMSKAVFPFIQAAILGGWVAGSLTINRAIAKWGIPKIKYTGIILSVLGGVLLGIITLFAPRDPYLLTSGMVLYAFGANWIIGLYFPECMEILPEIKGVTASLLTSVRLMIAAFVVALAGSLYDGTIYPLTAIILGTIAVFLPTLIYYEKRKPATIGVSIGEHINH